MECSIDKIIAVNAKIGNDTIFTLDENATIDKAKPKYEWKDGVFWRSDNLNAISDVISTDKYNLSEETMESIFKYIADKFNKVPTMKHQCHNCGATLEIDVDKHIFNCPYCESVYAIGTQNIYDFI